jgi:hypothetical protein
LEGKQTKTKQEKTQNSVLQTASNNKIGGKNKKKPRKDTKFSASND